jgi:mannose-6-phosphate isomerase-like protein (cupin superfamily)
MHVIGHDEQPLEKWRDGVMTRMRVSALTDGRQLCIFDQYCDFGLGAPTHVHAVEEILEVVSGAAEIWLGDEVAVVKANQSVLIPAGMRHGFRNIQQDILQTRATLASCIFEASYEDRRELSRRWSPGWSAG